MSRFTNTNNTYTNHTSSSHFLQSSHHQQPPPSSFRTGGGIRNSLKKIPSSLFTSKNKDKFTIHMDDPKTTTKTTTTTMNTNNSQFGTNTTITNRMTSHPAIPSFLANNASPPRTEKDKSTKLTKKAKARKGLADIFGWGNSNSSNNAPAPQSPPRIISPPSALVPSPPRHQRQKEDIIPKPSAVRRVSSKHSIPGLSGWTSLRPPAGETPARARPSMGADPFGRKAEGAERVEQINQCGELYERRGSISSSKALSSKTYESSDNNNDKRGSVGSSNAHSSSTHHTTNSITSSKAISTKTVDSDYTIRFHGEAEIRKARHMSPVPARATLVELPSRANSLAKKPDQGVGSGTVRPIQPSHLVKPSVPQQAPAIRKEKTRSRVWGLLGIKGKKSKDVLSQEDSRAAPAVNILQRLDTLTPSKLPKRVSSINAMSSYPIARAAPRPPPSAYQAPAPTGPPTLHLTQPSIDFNPDYEVFGPTIGHSQLVGSGKSTQHYGSATQRLSRTVPKRKSLNGLFGLTVKDHDHFEAVFADNGENQARREEIPPPSDGELEVPEAKTATLRRVASATDKLVDLVTHFNFSPMSHTSQRTIQPMESLDSIASTIKEAHGNSPTPMRKTRSGVLSAGNSASPLRQAVPNVSPLKLALHRKQIAAPAVLLDKPKSKTNIFAQALLQPKSKLKPQGEATLKVSQASSGSNLDPSPGQALADSQATLVSPPPPKRNIFAPPTPQVTAEVLARQPVVDETVGRGHARPISAVATVPRMGPTVAPTPPARMETDVPQDLRDLFVDADDVLSAVASPVAGLPQRPTVRPLSSNVRRRRNPPPAPLPVDPIMAPAQSTMLDIEDIQYDLRGSVYSEFDFTSEYANLDTGNHRASFVEALHRVQHHDAHDLPPLPPLPLTARNGTFGIHDHLEDAVSERESGSSTETMVVASRRNPFMGTFAFQQHASTIRASHSPKAESIVDFSARPVEPESPLVHAVTQAEFELDDTMQLAPPPLPRNHRRDESGLSIATMSSIGAIIETGIAGEYTNYFDVEFARDNEQRDSSTTSTDRVSQMLDDQPAWNAQYHSRSTSVASNASQQRSHRRGHSRNTSIASLASIDGIEHYIPNGPPVSMHNLKRSSYISKHRKSASGSFDAAAFGRSDWAAHKRNGNGSADSDFSIMSASRIARPGLGERMFQLDGGVQLTSITASPPDAQNGNDNGDDDVEEESDVQQVDNGLGNDSLLGLPSNMHKPSFDSLIDSSRVTYDSLLDSACMSRDSLFDASVEVYEREQEFRLRPVSALSTTSSSEDSIFGPRGSHDKRDFSLRPISTATDGSFTSQDDTFVNAPKPKFQQTLKKLPSCIQADGEDTMTPVNFRRPTKPRSNRRRPAQLVFESDMETPGLTSPSASETSSRMSLETRLSEGPAGRPFFAVHHRQRSSAAVRPQATIREEPSLVDMKKNPSGYKEVTTVRSYLDWEREADDECRRIRDEWEDSEESKQAVSAFTKPQTQNEIMRFLTESAVMFKPLEQQIPKAHRRKSSLADARVALSPYGLPLPKPPVHGGQGQQQKPRGSLITKFERTNSATSSHFSDDEFSSSTGPSSAIFAQFVRDHPPTPPPCLKKLPEMSPFKFNLELKTGYSSESKKQISKNDRARVDSVVRRQALGWGKRRASDGPVKVLEAEEPVPKIPPIFARPRVAMRDKENIQVTATSPTKRSSPVKRAPGGRRLTKLASMPKGLRA